MSKITLYKGDCLTESDKIKSGSVDAIITDLPYGTIKNISHPDRPNSQGNENYTSWDNAIPPEKVMAIANRILRKNGKLILFSQQPYSNDLMNSAIPNVPYNYTNIWLKNNFANGLVVNKATVNYYEDILVFGKNHDTEDLHPLRNYLSDCKKESGLTNKQFNNLFSDYTNKQGNRDRSVLEHYWQPSQFCMPTQEIYKNILQPTGFFKRSYEELKAIDDNFKKEFESTFNLWEGKKYKSNVFVYPLENERYHPTQKPITLMEDLIKTYTNEGDLIADLTIGSGSTMVACDNTNRDGIGIDKGKCETKRKVNNIQLFGMDWVDICKMRLRWNKTKQLSML